MDEQELCRKRLLDLSNQAYYKGVVCFSDFLNLNELHIYHSLHREFPVLTESFGGYDGAERQMAAFIPDALSYVHLQEASASQGADKARTGGKRTSSEGSELQYPIGCIRIVPASPKYAEKLTHRDILGAVMHLGIERNRLGDIICREGEYYLFCEQDIYPFLLEQLTKIRHTAVRAERYDLSDGMETVSPDFEERSEMIASNRIDAIIARAYRLSRSESAALLAEDKVFVNGRGVSNCNESCNSGDIISIRGKGRFIFETADLLTKKGKLKVNFKYFK